MLVGHIARNIIKRLYAKAGIVIPSWDVGPPFDGTEVHFVEVEYYTGPTSADGVLFSTATFVTGNTYAEIATKLESAMISIQNPVQLNPIRWGVMTLFSRAGASDRRMVSQINMQRVHVEVEFISQLKVQNVTEANTGADPNDALATNIEANPLIGKHYARKTWKNGFDVHW